MKKVKVVLDLYHYLKDLISEDSVRSIIDIEIKNVLSSKGDEKGNVFVKTLELYKIENDLKEDDKVLGIKVQQRNVYL